MSKEKKSGAVGRIYHLQVVDKYEAEIKRLKHELEEALQEISSLKQCDCIVRGAE